MVKLKTLKDLKLEELICCKECGDQTNQDDGWCFKCSTTPSTEVLYSIRINNLKQEAIKWVKDDTHCSNVNPCKECKGLINGFKFFFNIAEEDLK